MSNNFPEFLPSPRSSLAGNLGPDGNDSSDDQESPTISDTRIEDGKLLFEKRWYGEFNSANMFQMLNFVYLGIIEGNLFLLMENNW